MKMVPTSSILKVKIKRTAHVALFNHRYLWYFNVKMIYKYFQKSLKFSIILTTLGVLVFGFVCTGMIGHVSMHTPINSIGTTALMPTDNQECCNTNISKHIESWKDTLLVVPRQVKDGLLLLLLGLAAAFAFASLRFWHNPNDRERLSYRFYIRDNPELALFNQLKLAFARGILNPKIY